MATPHFINTQIKAGIWRGDLTGMGQTEPDLRVTHQGTELRDVNCSYDVNQDIWQITVPIPAAMIADGVQTFVVSDASGITLDTFTLIAGEPLADDLRAEISLLRDELDILKKAFRKSCGES